MSGWMFFALGFVASPLLIAALLYLLARSSMVIPAPIHSAEDLQATLRQFLGSRTADVLFVKDRETSFLVRVMKRTRKTMPDTLVAEIRNSDGNRPYYETVRRALADEGVEFRQSVTRVRGTPRRLRVAHDQGGPLAITAISHALIVGLASLSDSDDIDLLAAERDPTQWRRLPATA